MLLTDKGYGLELAREEAEMLHKLTGNATRSETRDMGLTDEEAEMMSALFEMLDIYLNGKQA